MHLQAVANSSIKEREIPEPMKEPKFLFEIKLPIAMFRPNSNRNKGTQGRMK